MLQNRLSFLATNDQLIILDRVMNIIRPGSISKIQKPFTKDAHMANLNAFLDACRSFGVPDDQLFAPEDLWEAKNIPKVVLTMLSIGKKVSYTFIFFS